jgi:alkanesulfonate monooxygenase SsuD/methylene tetrahydromethanopterin reductase-like flavin-dependent oxidoreductase (luciferase family)
LFDNERTTFEGKHYQLFEAPCQPVPVQAHLPLLVGGGGEKRTLRIAAEHADEWNVWGDPELCGQKAEVLARHCDSIGRDPSTIVHSTQAMMFLSEDEEWLSGKRGQEVGRPVIVGNPEEVTDIVGRYRDVGIDELIVPEWNFGPMPRRKDTLDLFIERVAPSLR